MLKYSSSFFRNQNKKGVAERIRTSDFFLRREALYPLSYSNVITVSIRTQTLHSRVLSTIINGSMITELSGIVNTLCQTIEMCAGHFFAQRGLPGSGRRGKI